jgi:hypothetical protein
MAGAATRDLWRPLARQLTSLQKANQIFSTSINCDVSQSDDDCRVKNPRVPGKHKHTIVGGVHGGNRVTLEIQGPDGSTNGIGTASSANPNARASSRAAATGWHMIVLKSSGLPQAGVPFTLTVEYTASQTITPKELCDRAALPCPRSFAAAFRETSVFRRSN